MKNKYKSFVSVFSLLLISVFLSFLFEYTFSNFNEITQNDYMLEINDSKINYLSDSKTYSFDIDNKFVSTVSLNYYSNENCVYKIIIDSNEKTEIEDEAYSNISYAATNIYRKCSNLILVVPNEINLSSVTVTNKTVFSISRFLIVLLLSFLLLNIALNKKIKKEFLFAFLSITFGTVLIFYEGPSLKAWDEQIHFANSWSLSYINNIENSESSLICENLQYPIANTNEEKIYISNWLNENSKTMQVQSKDNFIKYNKFVYLPQAFGIAIGRVLNLPFIWILYLGKFMNLIFYTFIFKYGIKKTGSCKNLLFVIGLQPTSIFLASSYSYDPILISLDCVGTAFIFEELFSENKINEKRLFISILFIIVGSLAKLVYIPLLLLILSFRRNKYKSKSQKIILDLLVILIVVLSMSTFVTPTLSSVINGTVMSGDPRGGATSMTGQMHYILSNSLEYFKLLVKSIFSTSINYVFFNNISFGYIDMNSISIIFANICYDLILLSCIFATNKINRIFCEREISLNCVYQFAILIGIIALIWTALYLSYTPVGSHTINGVQSRYYIPLFVLLFILIFEIINTKKKEIIKVSEKNQEYLLIIGIITVWMAVLLKLFLF